MLPTTTYKSETDHQWQGDEFTPDKDYKMTRVMFHNVNGLTLKGTDGLDIFINEQRSLQVDVQAISEHCLDTTKFQVVHSATKILRQQCPGQATIQFDSRTDPGLNR